MKMSCDLCNSTEYEVIWDKEEREKQGKLQSVIIPGHIHSRNVMCTQCGLVYVDPKMSREELAKFYSEDYRKIYGGGDSLKAEKNHSYNASEILIGIKDVLYGRYLDIGCSTGELVETMQYYGKNRHGGLDNCYGIEPNIEHWKIAHDKGLKVVNGSIEDVIFEDKFYIISMLNALEHVYSPTEVLTKINSLLEDDGYLLVSVPNLYNKTINIPVDAFLSNAHLYNFSVFTIEALFNKCGFKAVGLNHITEEMGDKLYVLGIKKANVNYKLPPVSNEVIARLKKYLNDAQEVFEMKIAIQRAGFK
jgi:2-polyprenyl-3-methyl-5-hydroxy-6-metoxy-1,4-benzoquinol methylase